MLNLTMDLAKREKKTGYDDGGKPGSHRAPLSPSPLPPPPPRSSTSPDTCDQVEDAGIQSQNPFLIELIVDSILKYTDKEDLNSCRLVCHLWHRLSLPAWMQWYLRTGIKLVGDGELGSFIRTVYPSSSSSSSSPYMFSGVKRATNFHIEALSPGIDAGLLDSFWSNCGAWIVRLKLSRWRCSDLALFADVLCSSFTPKLEELEVEVVLLLGATTHPPLPPPMEGSYEENQNLTSLSVALQGNPKQFPLEWEQVLGCYPNLKDLRVSQPSGSLQPFDKLLLAIVWIRRVSPTSLESLKRMDMALMPNEDEEDVQGEDEGGADLFDATTVALLHHPFLTFSSLGLRFDIQSAQQELHFWHSLSAQEFSLKELSVYMNWNMVEVEPFRHVVIQNVETLTGRGFPFPSFAFILSHFPNVVSLRLQTDLELSDGWTEGEELVQNSLEEEREPGFRRQPSPRLTQFSCDYNFGGGWGGRDAVRLVADWMPNLKVLKMVLGHGSFGAVCQDLPNLEEMVIWGDGLGDESLTGTARVGKGSRSSALLLPSLYHPNITVFQQLKSLEMDMRRARVAKNFSVISVVHGFARLPKLQRLKINATVEIRESVHVALQEHLPFGEILEQKE